MAGVSVVNENENAFPSTDPSSAFVSAGTVTVYSVARGSFGSGANTSALVPIHRHAPFGACVVPCTTMLAGGALSSPARSSGLIGRLKTIDTSLGSDVLPCGPEKTTANARLL